MIARKLFICSAIAQCQETVNCCAHKQPHIKDERCVPRQCRYAAEIETVDCVLYEKDKPVAPVPEPVQEPVKEEPVITFIEPETVEDQLLKDVKEKEEKGDFVTLDEAAKELNIKAAVKKQASTKKKGRK